MMCLIREHNFACVLIVFQIHTFVRVSDGVEVVFEVQIATNVFGGVTQVARAF